MEEYGQRDRIKEILIKYSPKSISTGLCLMLKVRSIEAALGSQKEGTHKASVNPDLVPLKTTLTSPSPFGTVKNSVTFLTSGSGMTLMYSLPKNLRSLCHVFCLKAAGHGQGECKFFGNVPVTQIGKPSRAQDQDSGGHLQKIRAEPLDQSQKVKLRKYWRTLTPWRNSAKISDTAV